jgi:hypothetical protein
MNLRAFLVPWSLTLAVSLIPGWCLAAKRAITDPTSEFEGPPQEPAAIELFDAIEAGQIEVKFIPKDDKQARVRIKNKSGNPLTVQLPEAFAARPVLAQAGQFAIGALPGDANGGQNGASQNLGSTFNGQNNGPGGRPNFFNVPADKTVDLRVTCVCLDYGKPTPRAAIPYELVRLDTVCKDASLATVLAKLDRGNQREVQAAAWHIANGMAWQELAAVRIEHLVEPNEPFFSLRQLHRAQQLVRDATDAVPRPQEPQPEAALLSLIDSR